MSSQPQDSSTNTSSASTSTPTHPLTNLADKLGAVQDSEATFLISSTPYTTTRHTHAWIYYRGVHTTVPISILGTSPLPTDRRIYLQCRGWRTGLFVGPSVRSLVVSSTTQTQNTETQTSPDLIDITLIAGHPWDPSADLKTVAPEIERDIHRVLSSPPPRALPLTAHSRLTLSTSPLPLAMDTSVSSSSLLPLTPPPRNPSL